MDVAAERFSKTSNGSVSIMKYIPVKELDYGLLSCWASNDVGHQIHPCIFQVVAAGRYFLYVKSYFEKLFQISVPEYLYL